MNDRWAYPTPMRMQRQSGSAPKARAVKSPPVAPEAEADKAPDGKTEATPATIAPEQ